MKIQVYIEGQRLDLFDDENISITQGVQNVKDISKLFADFSQSFSVPASDNNNAIFKHYYNADIDGGFDARTRKLSTIDVNTLDFKRGKMTLTEVKIKNGVPASYKINFVGDIIKIKDELGDDKLFNLTWLDNFNHDYSADKVKTGLTTGLDFTVDTITYTNAVIYPLISYKKQYFYSSDLSSTGNGDTFVNIAFGNTDDDGVDFTELKPAIRLSLIIQAIQEQYDDINFVGSFFESSRFQQIYMNLNTETTSLANGRLLVATESGTLPSPSPSIDWVKAYGTITPKAGFETTPYRFAITINDQIVYETTNPNGLTGAQIRHTGEVVRFGRIRSASLN